MRTLYALPLLLLTATAAQARDCRFEAPRDLQLDLAGVSTLIVELGRHEIRLTGAGDGDGMVRGRACASAQDYLDDLQIVQERQCDRLVLRAEHRKPDRKVFVLFGKHYEYLTMDVRVPERLTVELQVGSGDAWIEGVAALDTTIGSGDVEVRRIAGELQARVGSGDLEARDVGSLRLRSVGSGDVTVERIRGDASVGSIGSGDVALREVGGNVEVGSIGSGDLVLRGVRGSVSVDSLGSGDISARDVDGDFRLRSKGSGDVSLAGIGGQTLLPRKR